MNTYLRQLILILAVMALPVEAHASIRGAQILSDQELATIKGGFCPFEKCETSPTGVCQPVPPNVAALCALATCRYTQSVVLNVEVYGCALAGKETCSKSRSYRQCVLAFELSTCSNGSDTTYCGFIVDPTCTVDSADRTCICGIDNTSTPCEWTNCAQ